ncbi:MAG: peptidoglycan-binding domain-containing protein, partial [Myxococcota bacterium]
MPPGRSRQPAAPPRRDAPSPATGPAAGPGNAARAERIRGGAGPALRAGVGNAALAASLALSSPAGAEQAAPAPTAAAAASDVPAWAARPHVGKTLKEGATGPEVTALQKALGAPETGVFDAATTAAVKAFQEKNALGADGIAGGNTLRALGLRDDMRSASHDDDAFVPKYRATAYSESDMYRTGADPYAVGAITKPAKEDDAGGKTYGTYQFESYVYRDGTKAGESAVSGSTVLRFVNWAENPYGARLKAVVDEHGVASAAFDTLWTELTAKENKAFGQAQERFLEHDVSAKVTAFFDTAKVPAALREDPDLKDVAIGTVNQYGGLASGMATDLAAKIATMPAPTADQVGAALQDIKRGKVQSHFKSSPNAWGGIQGRIDREKRLFQ